MSTPKILLEEEVQGLIEMEEEEVQDAELLLDDEVDEPIPDIETVEVDEGLRGEPGPVGPQGEQGIQGEKGDKGNPGVYFEFDQELPALEWNVNHGLGFKPTVFVFDRAGSMICADVQHLSTNQTLIRFTYPMAGTARFN